MDINESPVYVLLNPAINHTQKDLPVTIYESGMLLIMSYGSVGTF
jgi:COP9 signalosome complex subunit 6